MRIVIQENAVFFLVSDSFDVALGEQSVVPSEGSSAAVNQQANFNLGSDFSDDDLSDHSDYFVYLVYLHRVDLGCKGSKKEK